MPKVFDVVKAAGQYTDQNGQQKTRWIKCGMIVKTQNGKMALKLDALPLGTPTDGDGGIWFALTTPQQQGQQQGQQQPQGQQPPQQPMGGGWQGQQQGQQPPNPDGFSDDDIPF